MKYPEVLSPAGDMEKLIAAVQYGADAVYFSDESFGMRATAQNFNDGQLKEAIDYCHTHGVSAYIACNVLLNNDEIPLLKEALFTWQDMGADALIISDMGIFMLARQLIPNMELHVSTQAGVTNYLTANQLYNLGASRVVLARELSLKEIRTIRDNTPKELVLEAFVHGAMCVSFSGRCLISQYMTGRDANHGQCAQSCRWRYHLTEEKRPGQFFPIEEDERGTHFFNAEDLCMLEHLDKLAEAGVDSFKIEGRAKSVFYTAAVTNAYRIATDIYLSNPDSYDLPNWLKQEPFKVSHRRYSTGFYLPQSPPEQVYESAGYIREWEVTAIVEGYDDGYIVASQRNKFSVGDTIEILEPGRPPVSLIVEEIINSQGQQVDSAPHPTQQIRIPYILPVVKGALIRRPL